MGSQCLCESRSEIDGNVVCVVIAREARSAQSEATASRTMKSSRRYVNSTILLLLFLCFHTPYNIKLFCVFEKTGRTTAMTMVVVAVVTAVAVIIAAFDFERISVLVI